MKTQKHTITTVLFGIILAAGSQTSHAQDSYQHQMLFNPSESNLAAEARGRVMIYDGLREEDIDRVMETQFDRIESMMFINTKRRQSDGEYASDDDC